MKQIKLITTLVWLIFSSFSPLVAEISAAEIASDTNAVDTVKTELLAEVQIHFNSPVPAQYSWQKILQKAKLMEVKLSPNGETLAYLTREQQGVSVWLMDLASKQKEKLFDSLIVTKLYWSKDSDMLYLMSDKNMAYVDLKSDKKRPELFVQFNQKEGRFYAIDNSALLETGGVLIRKSFKTQGKKEQHQLIRVSRDGTPSVLYSGDRKVYDHLFDEQGRLQFIRVGGEREHHIYQLNGQEGLLQELKLVYTSNVLDKVQMIRFDQANNELYVVAYNKGDLVSAYALNVNDELATNSNQKTSRLIHQDPEQIADLMGLVKSNKTQEILLASYYSDRLKIHAVHPAMQRGIESINSALSGSISVTADLSNSFWLVRQSAAHIGHHLYHIYDVANDRIEPILNEVRAENVVVKSSQLSKKIPVSYTASDGMLIHGYVMLPKGTDAAQAPLLVQVHGGPFNRAYGGNTPWQYMVNKGYIIFQPNFRASKGYGLKYMRAGKAEFSGRVQQDIKEGVEFLLSQGIGHKEKLGVFGHSFGGFSVLSLMSNYPDMFQAGFASAGPTELISTLFKLDQKDINSYDGIPLTEALSYLLVDIDNETQTNRMNTNSPAAKWQSINKPLFIWAGERDQRVPVVDVRDHAIKLKEAGKPVELLIDKNTGHNFNSNDLTGRLAFMYLTENFFAKHFNKPRPTSTKETVEYIQKYTVY